ncbi:MAG: dGTPase, partial [Eudoraea sp.]|nr:dGTPase [Eudoraea sp.]NNK31396.1 dGTPase [Flavobacteriaceae bacterium]
VRIFMENEYDILNGIYDVALLDKSQYKAQIADIIDLSVSRIYRSEEVIEKEIAGYRILADILEVFSTALIRDKQGKASNYDRLMIGLLPPVFRNSNASTYHILLNTSCFVASLSDGSAVHIHNKITGKQL